MTAAPASGGGVTTAAALLGLRELVVDLLVEVLEAPDEILDAAGLPLDDEALDRSGSPPRRR